MKIKELKKVIANLPDEMEVILQKDSEGNGYSPLSGADPDSVLPSALKLSALATFPSL